MTSLDPQDQTALRRIIGREQRREQLLDRESLRRFDVATGGDGSLHGAMPPVAHWSWFADTVANLMLGDDGHPRRGDFLPAVNGLPRRMFVGTCVSFIEALTLDAPAEMASVVSDIALKSGSTGDLMFVTVDRTVRQRGRDCARERQTLVYRAAAEGVLPLPQPVATAPGGRCWRPGTVELFRFSAATFNSHRIHYDAAYAREEGYPALVVQGPLVAARLARFAAEQGALAGLTYRAQAPLFADGEIWLDQDAPNRFTAKRCDGVVAASIEVTYVDRVPDSAYGLVAGQ